MIKNILIATAVVFVFLFFTNPTLNDFKEFVPGRTGKSYKTKVNVSKESNYLIYSVYKYELFKINEYDELEWEESGQFNGFVKNFYKK